MYSANAAAGPLLGCDPDDAVGRPLGAWLDVADLDRVREALIELGKVIRKLRIDEIPQIFNVIRGDMSLVGPRPERPEFVEGLSESIPFYQERHAAKPGITGWAQLRYPYGSSIEDALQKLQFDLYYLKNQSLILDLTIMLQTIEVVVWGKGAR